MLRTGFAAGLKALSAAALMLSFGAQAGEEFAPKLPNASNEGEQAIAKFKLADGIKCELWAAEPMLANPVCLYINHKGGVYVVESFRFGAGVDTGSCGLTVEQDLALRTVDERVAFIKNKYAANLDKFTKNHDRIRLIEDSDGDGKADRASVFADGFNDIPDGIAAGVMEFRGDVFFTCIPRLWKLRDTDGDGKADTRKALSYGYGVHGGYLGHDLHGLRVGPDGKIYYSIGDRAASVEFEGKKFDYPDEGTVWRCNPDGSELEVFAHGLRNPQELAFDQYGNLFTGDNNSDGGDKARFVYIVEGGDTGWRIGYQFQPTRGPWNQEKLWHAPHEGQAAYIVPPLSIYANGPSGFTYYPGTGLTDAYKDHFFLANFSGGPGNSGVFTVALKPKGAYFELTDSKQIIWNELATDCDFGPDGALYVSDWVNGWGMPNKGRVYKLYGAARKGSPLIVETKKILAEGVEKRSDADLLKLLEHADMRVRQLAQFQLADKGKDAIALLEPVAAKSTVQLARIHAIWALGQISRKEADAIKTLPTLLKDADVEFRAQALKVIADRKMAAAFDSVLPLTKDPSARVQFFAAMALGKIGNPKGADAIFDLLRENKDSDPFIRHACVMGLYWMNSPETVLAKSGDSSASVRMGVLLALRQFKSPEVARFLKDADPLVVLEAARAINDVPINAAMPQLAALLQNKPAASSDGPQFKFTLEYWSGLKGNIDALTKNPNYPSKPSKTEELSIFELPPNTGDNYGSRISGVITAPQTGNYTFWVCGDDMAELWLSTDEKPENKQKIAAAPEYCNPREWEKRPEQKSKPIALQAGKKYYIEALHLENGGEDSLAVGWQLPDGKMQRPIGDAGKTDETFALSIRVLNANYRTGQTNNAAALAEYASRSNATPALRAEALTMLGEWAKPFPRDRVQNLFRPLPDRDGAPAAAALKPVFENIFKTAPGNVLAAAAQAAGKLDLKDASPSLVALVENVKKPVEARIEALKALAAMKDKNHFDALKVALSDKEVKLRQEGAGQLAKLNPDEAVPMLTKTLESASTPEKQTAIAILAKMKTAAADAVVTSWVDKYIAGQVPAELKLDIAEAARQSANKDIKNKVTQHDAKLPKDDEAAPFRDALVGGDAENGAKLLREHQNAQCLRCHKLNGEGGDVGPELKGLATRQPKREYYLESLVTPSAQIAQGFESLLIKTNDGKVFTGILKGETDKEVTVVGTDAKPIVIKKDQIKERKGNKLSAMPPMGEVLTKSEVRDIVEYLSTLK